MVTSFAPIDQYSIVETLGDARGRALTSAQIAAEVAAIRETPAAAVRADVATAVNAAIRQGLVRYHLTGWVLTGRGRSVYAELQPPGEQLAAG